MSLIGQKKFAWGLRQASGRLLWVLNDLSLHGHHIYIISGMIVIFEQVVRQQGTDPVAQNIRNLRNNLGRLLQRAPHNVQSSWDFDDVSGSIFFMIRKVWGKNALDNHRSAVMLTANNLAIRIQSQNTLAQFPFLACSQLFPNIQMATPWSKHMPFCLSKQLYAVFTR